MLLSTPWVQNALQIPVISRKGFSVGPKAGKTEAMTGSLQPHIWQSPSAPPNN